MDSINQNRKKKNPRRKSMI